LEPVFIEAGLVLLTQGTVGFDPGFLVRVGMNVAQHGYALDSRDHAGLIPPGRRDLTPVLAGVILPAQGEMDVLDDVLAVLVAPQQDAISFPRPDPFCCAPESAQEILRDGDVDLGTLAGHGSICSDPEQRAASYCQRKVFGSADFQQALCRLTIPAMVTQDAQALGSPQRIHLAVSPDFLAVV